MPFMLIQFMFSLLLFKIWGNNCNLIIIFNKHTCGDELAFTHHFYFICLKIIKKRNEYMILATICDYESLLR